MKEKSSIQSSFVFSGTVNPEMLSAKVYRVKIFRTIDICVMRENYKNEFIKTKVLYAIFDCILKIHNYWNIWAKVSSVKMYGISQSCSTFWKTLRNFNLLCLKYTCIGTVEFFFVYCPSSPRKICNYFQWRHQFTSNNIS